ncbi:hypothetical protein G1H11_07430 [Phytoactinopolyspora alkaliphila]|uniref:Uncharacterized protein n=1 Tax=Phytoactinopolyspora alkaliphila TaxID=1783498 RepID=A0A6N9YJK5_9ACTN|nr:hypothetical protein [Phytoactinopolyspora alkaliphila]NED95144.1 hypothetical protein [Phytoactinopolyspora alkaliphila]
MNLDAAATELYGLPLDEFVPARDALAKEAKRQGAADVAARIKGLRKPTHPAWLANQLVRAHRQDVDELVGVGDEMREATADGDGARLRELAARRKEKVDALLAKVAKLNGGKRPSHDAVEALNETLLAATADPGVAAELQVGRLTHPLQHVGFGLPGGGAAQVISLSQARAAREKREDGRGAPPRPSSPAKPRARRADDEDVKDEDAGEGAEDATTARERRLAQQRAEAEREFEEADAAVTEAEEHVGGLETALDERQDALESAEAKVERLLAELEAAKGELENARTGVDDAEEELGEARADLEAARKRRREAKRKLL